MKKILVSGAGGFLGSAIIPQLLQNQQLQVFAVSSQKDRIIKMYGLYPNFEFVEEFPQGIEVFINCVFPADANGMQLANGLDYIANLYQKAKEQNVGAVINISTQSVYSQTKTKPATEESVPDLGTKYAVGKYAVEKLTNAFFGDIPHINLRMASLIGPTSDGRISNRFVKQVIAGMDIHIVADCQSYGFLDVRDAASGIAKCALANYALWEEVLNLSSGSAYTLQEIAECVVHIGLEFGFKSAVIVGEEIGDIRNSMLDGSKFEKKMNWRAEIPLEQTIRDTYIHYVMESGEYR